MSLETLLLMMQLAFWLLAGGLVAVILLPPVFTVLGLSRIASRHLASIPEVWERDFPIHPQVYELLHEHGFELLGGIQIRHWLWFNYWCLSRRYRVFGGRHSGCFALVTRSDFRKRDQIAFLTLYADGGWVWTANYSWLPPITTRQHSSQTIRFDPQWTWPYRFARLLEKHRGAFARFQLPDRRAIEHDYLPVLLDSCRSWTWRRNLLDRGQELLCLAGTAGFAAGIGLALLAMYRTGPMFLPAILAIVCGLWLFPLLFIWGEWSGSRGKPNWLNGLCWRVTPVSDPRRRPQPTAEDPQANANVGNSSDAIRAQKPNG